MLPAIRALRPGPLCQAALNHALDVLMPGAGRSRPGPTGSSPGNEPSSPSPWGRAKGRPGSCDAEHQLGSLHQTGRALNRSLDALQLEPVDLGQDPGYLQLAQANEPSSTTSLPGKRSARFVQCRTTPGRPLPPGLSRSLVLPGILS